MALKYNGLHCHEAISITEESSVVLSDKKNYSPFFSYVIVIAGAESVGDKIKFIVYQPPI